MKLRNLIVSVCLAMGLAACGNSSGGDDGEPADAGQSEGDDDDDGTLLGDDDVGPNECDPETCESLNKDCGRVADGCGELLDCGECGERSRCGIVTANVCTDLDSLCEPQSRDDACENKDCGVAGDGCGGSYECGDCEEDEICGAAGPFRCGRLSTIDDNNCPAKIESCEQVDAECGLVGNGCGGLLDCDEQVGGCDSGEVCGVEDSYTCGDAPDCEPLSPTEACEGKCGLVSNGCGSDVEGGLVDCSAVAGGACPDDAPCGGSGEPNVCGPGTCEPIDSGDACSAVECGAVTDGCSGSYDCGGCSGGEICRSGLCEGLCEPIPRVQACSGRDCGMVGDGCGGTHDCGSCDPGEACGQLDAFMCDPVPPSDCAPLSDEEACDGRACGLVFDGCGADTDNIVDCSVVNGGCTDPQVCGVKVPFQCDIPDIPDCAPAASCAELGWECGMAVDQCGNVFDCAAEGLFCNAQIESCIGGIDGPTQCLNGTEGSGTCNVCDSIPDCSSASQPTVVTGRVITPGASDGDTANQLGVPNAFVYILRNNSANELPPITSGIPPDGADYGTACDRCDEQDLGPVLVSTTTNALGVFELEGNIPVGEPFVLVVQIGKWRRAQTVNLQPSAACNTTALLQTLTRLPRTQSDGAGANIPRVAVSTGAVDAMECVFHKLGVASSEFADPGPLGATPARIHVYRSPSGGGARATATPTSSAALYGDRDRLFSYDMLVFDCEGNEFNSRNADDPKIREFVNRGGRMFASHWSYTWLFDNGSAAYNPADPFDAGLGPSAIWGNSGDAPADTAWVSLGRPGAIPGKIQNFADWLENEGAAAIDAQGRYAMSTTEPRDLAMSVGAASEEFVYRHPDDSGLNNACRPCPLIASEANCTVNPSCVWSTNNTCVYQNDCTGKQQAACQADSACNWTGSACTFAENCDSGGVDANQQGECQSRAQCGWNVSSVQQFSFNTPYGAPAADICGRVAYSGFHVVADPSGYSNVTFPDHCTGDLTGQEKVLAYMLFDLAACVSTGGLTPPECTPLTNADCSGRCGIIADGCGGTVDCQQCPAGELCLPGGICSAPECTSTTCEAEGASCGALADGCGGTLDCGECPDGQVCGLLTPNQCTVTCLPTDEATACEGKCGFLSDECSDVHDCGECPPGLSCVDNECTDQSCDPLDECPAGLECGQIGDGCDGLVSCGECTPPEVCGGGGEANVCDPTVCTPLSCASSAAECGFIGDGCGAAIDCGPCPPGQICGVGGPNKCGGCNPLSCAEQNAECGMVGDGCGSSIDCGECPDDETCGSEAPNRCGNGPGCSVRTCEDAGAECGLVGDGCDGVLDCGECSEDQVCGIDEPYQCGDPPPCVPLTCGDVRAECGAIGDGCGGVVQCGTCDDDAVCGRDAANRCPDVAR